MMLASGLMLAALAALPSAIAGSMPSREQILSDMTLANSYFTNKWPVAGCSSCLPGSRPSNIWTRGTYFEGLLAFYRFTMNPSFYNYAVEWGTFHDWNLRYGDTDRQNDSQCAPQSYIELYEFDSTQTNRLTHAISNANFWVASNSVARVTYVDAIHMSLPLFAKLTPVTGNTNYAAKMYDYFHYTKSTIGRSNGLYNATDHLWWRDTNFLSGYTASDGTQQKCYWSRGNGWAFVALARIIDVLPSNDPHYAEYLQTFQEMAAALKAVQRSDGFWNVNLGYTNDFPGPETSGTAMFTYGLAWGINHGHLDINTYLPAAINGWNALAAGALHHTADTNNGFLGYVQSTGDRPASGQPVTYDSVPNFEDYALGAFLLAGSEVYALNALPVITSQPSSRTNYAGRTATFSVIATGTEPLSYQWIKDDTNALIDSTNVSGSRTNILTLGNVQDADAGSYAVVITNAAGGTKSDPATLTVIHDLPGINGAVRVGTNLVFGGTGAIAGDTYYVLASTNVAARMTNWVRVATNSFGVGGTFSVTNAVESGKRRHFFRLQVP
jgi:unsaturated rhamnogalacturonyl hydrolase